MIESAQNDKIKHLSRLITDNRFRKKSGTFPVEGRQENERAARFGYLPLEYFICKELFSGAMPEGSITDISPKLYEKLAYRGTSEGIIGIYKAIQKDISKFIPKKDSTIVIIEGAEKPGNLGAIMRSCEAFGIVALVITDTKADLYNPNAIRSSVGCLFGMDIFCMSNEDIYHYLIGNDFNIYSTYLSATAADIQEKDFTKKSAIIFGTEHSGISNYWLDKSSNILIPMAGTIDSLNLSNAVAIACYESLRQKKSRP